MNAVRRQRPSISPDDIDRLLFHLEDARNFVIKYSSAQDFNSPEKATAERVVYAVDELALQITEDNRYFWGEAASAGGNEIAFQRAMEKQGKRRRLMGIHMPLRATRIFGKWA